MLGANISRKPMGNMHWNASRPCLLFFLAILYLYVSICFGLNPSSTAVSQAWVNFVWFLCN